MRRGPIAGAALALALSGAAYIPAASASASPEAGALVITGTASGTTTIRFPAGANLSTAIQNPFESAAQIRSAATVAGIVIWRHGNIVFGEIRDKSLRTPIVFPAFKQPPSGGDYQVELITDGPARVSLPLTGTTRQITVRPSTRLELERETSNFLLPDSPVTYESVPVDLREGSLAIITAVGVASAPLTVTQLSNMCIERQNLPCDASGATGSQVYGFGGEFICSGGVSCEIDGAGTMWAAGMPAGHDFAAADAETTALQQGARLLALVISPAGQAGGGA